MFNLMQPTNGFLELEWLQGGDIMQVCDKEIRQQASLFIDYCLMVSALSPGPGVCLVKMLIIKTFFDLISLVLIWSRGKNIFDRTHYAHDTCHKFCPHKITHVIRLKNDNYLNYRILPFAELYDLKSLQGDFQGNSDQVLALILHDLITRGQLVCSHLSLTFFAYCTLTDK